MTTKKYIVRIALGLFGTKTPLAWNCRCTATELDDEAQATPHHALAGLPEASEGFRENVGKTGKIFGADHPYFQLSAAEARKIESQL